jgi:hypothetical protein
VTILTDLPSDAAGEQDKLNELSGAKVASITAPPVASARKAALMTR